MTTADRAFERYRARPDRDTLRALLTSHQSTVYNVCVQVLRREHDAEDAAQEALLEVARGAAGLREPRAFKRWLCRTALHTALDHLRRRRRRARHEEARASMKPTSPDPSADAIHEALSRLDDEDRCLLVEKYFERATLQTIAGREGISAAAVGKRVDRAKERFKRRLAQVGMTAIIPRVDSTLEDMRPAAVVPDLVSTSQALESALSLAGGTAMTAKLTLNGTALIVALLLLAAGGGGYLAVTRLAPDVSIAGRPVMKAAPEASPETQENKSVSLPAAALPPESAIAPPEPDPAELLSRLDRTRRWLESNPAAFRTAAEFNRWFRELKSEASGLRELILKDPASFLGWLASPANAAHASNLFSATISGKETLWENPSQSFGEFPAGLTTGLLELLHGSDDFIRTAVLQFGLTLKDAPASWRDQYAALLSDPEALIGELSAKALLTTGDLSVGEAGAVIGYLERLTDFEARANLIHSIGRVDRPEVRDWLLTTFESEKFSDPEGRLTFAGLATWLDPARPLDAVFGARAARILETAIRRVRDPQGYFYLVFGGMTLPLAEARTLLTAASAGAPTEPLRKAAAAMLARPDAELADGHARRAAWLDAYWAK